MLDRFFPATVFLKWLLMEYNINELGANFINTATKLRGNEGDEAQSLCATCTALTRSIRKNKREHLWEGDHGSGGSGNDKATASL